MNPAYKRLDNLVSVMNLMDPDELDPNKEPTPDDVVEETSTDDTPYYGDFLKDVPDPPTQQVPELPSIAHMVEVIRAGGGEVPQHVLDMLAKEEHTNAAKVLANRSVINPAEAQVPSIEHMVKFIKSAGGEIPPKALSLVNSPEHIKDVSHLRPQMIADTFDLGILNQESVRSSECTSDLSFSSENRKKMDWDVFVPPTNVWEPFHPPTATVAPPPPPSDKVNDWGNTATVKRRGLPLVSRQPARRIVMQKMARIYDHIAFESKSSCHSMDLKEKFSNWGTSAVDHTIQGHTNGVPFVLKPPIPLPPCGYVEIEIAVKGLQGVCVAVTDDPSHLHPDVNIKAQPSCLGYPLHNREPFKNGKTAWGQDRLSGPYSIQTTGGSVWVMLSGEGEFGIKFDANETYEVCLMLPEDIAKTHLCLSTFDPHHGHLRSQGSVTVKGILNKGLLFWTCDSHTRHEPNLQLLVTTFMLCANRFVRAHVCGGDVAGVGVDDASTLSKALVVVLGMLKFDDCIDYAALKRDNEFFDVDDDIDENTETERRARRQQLQLDTHGESKTLCVLPPAVEEMCGMQ
eukprot:m.52073 g.52073  ORF g.52073 m.52073 type:complete len:570 (-) comp21535_c0_seq2:63-1772(-)